MEKIKFLPEPENGFYNTLRQRVQTYFRENNINRYGNRLAIYKAVFFSSCFVILYFFILTRTLTLPIFLASWFLMGAFMLFAAMSMVHDAAHGVFSKRIWINELLLRFANLAGADGYMYKYKHTVSHHPYTNIHGVDIDLEQSGIVRVTPYSRTNKNHRFQELYMKALYPFFILFWVLVRDFKYYRLKQIGLVEPVHSRSHLVFLVFSKLFYIFYLIILPLLVLPVSFWQVIAGFICMQLGSGLIAMFALLSNHVVEDSIFVQPDEQGRINCTWGEHQLRTTDDYSPDSSIISFFFSGLNHHVAHHLFPKYCHVHYPVITKIVRETAAEFGLRYRYNSITGGLQSHFRLLKKLSRQNQPA